MSVDVLIVTFNSSSTIETCLNSIPRSVDGRAVTVHVWDNDSADGTVGLVRRRPGVQLWRSETNIGFAAACNELLRVSEGHEVCLLNPDVELLPGSLETLVRAVRDDPTIGIAAARLERPDGSPQPETARRKPSLGGVVLSRIGGGAIVRRLGLARSLFVDRDVECSVGALLVTRREVVEQVDGLDESVFMYLEDIEFCRRIRESGLRIRYLGTVVARHACGVSRSGSERQLDSLGPLVWVTYFYRHGCDAERVLARPALAGMYTFRALVATLTLNFDSARHAIGNARCCLAVDAPDRRGLSAKRT